MFSSPETHRKTAFGRRRLYLMRHGAVDYFAPRVTTHDGKKEVPLTEAGQEQAQAAGRALADAELDAAFCTPLLRTRQTLDLALAAAARSELSIETVAGLTELRAPSFDTVEVSRTALAARFAYSLDDAARPAARFFGEGELFADAYARVAGALTTLLRERVWTAALVVAHEGVNRLALGWASGGGLAVAQAFEQDLGCVNVLDVDMAPDPGGGAPRVERIIIKTVNALPRDPVTRSDRRTSIESLFGLEPGGVRRGGAA